MQKVCMKSINSADVELLKEQLQSFNESDTKKKFAWHIGWFNFDHSIHFPKDCYALLII